LSSNTPEVESKPVDEEALEDDDDYLFMPVKRAKSTIDHEISLYSSMYKSAVEDHNPLNFWRAVNEVC
jgi:hypothetical protein